jgi:hypothetical protein
MPGFQRILLMHMCWPVYRTLSDTTDALQGHTIAANALFKRLSHPRHNVRLRLNLKFLEY